MANTCKEPLMGQTLRTLQVPHLRVFFRMLLEVFSVIFLLYVVRSNHLIINLLIHQKHLRVLCVLWALQGDVIW